jgi:hypothetical protein
MDRVDSLISGQIEGGCAIEETEIGYGPAVHFIRRRNARSAFAVNFARVLDRAMARIAAMS